MKIGEAQMSSAVVPTGTEPQETNPTTASAPAEGALPVDIVTTDQANAFGASVGGSMVMAASERSARLHELAQAVRAGNYRPSAAQLANEILEQAELDARLASTL